MKQYVVDTVKLRKMMVERGILTASSLSVETGVNRNTIGKVLNGSIRPSADVMEKISSALDLAPETAGAIFFAENLRGA